MKTRCIHRQVNAWINCFQGHWSEKETLKCMEEEVKEYQGDHTWKEYYKWLWKALRVRKHHRDQLICRQSWKKWLKNSWTWANLDQLLLSWRNNERAGFLNSTPSFRVRSNHWIPEIRTQLHVIVVRAPLIKALKVKLRASPITNQNEDGLKIITSSLLKVEFHG